MPRIIAGQAAVVANGQQPTSILSRDQEASCLDSVRVQWNLSIVLSFRADVTPKQVTHRPPLHEWRPVQHVSLRHRTPSEASMSATPQRLMHVHSPADNHSVLLVYPAIDACKPKSQQHHSPANGIICLFARCKPKWGKYTVIVHWSSNHMRRR